MVNLDNFAGLVFADTSIHTQYVLYNRALFASLIFAVRQSSAKTTKIGPLKKISRYTVVPHPYAFIISIFDVSIYYRYILIHRHLTGW